MPAVTPRRLLIVVVAAFIVFTSLVALWTPPWEANDEPGHVGNIVSLVQGEWYRIEPDPALSCDLKPIECRNELHQPPLYYMAMSIWFRGLNLEAEFPAPARNPPLALGRPADTLFRHDVPGEAADERRVRALRVPSIACGVATILLAFATARCLTRDPWTPVVAASVVAFVPRFVFLSGTVNNDNLVDALGALLAFLAAYWVTRRPATDRARLLAVIALGLVFGALVLTKLSAAPLGLGLVLAVALIGADARGRAKLLAVAGAATVLVCGWWFVRNNAWYGDPFASEVTNDYLQPVTFALTPTEDTVTTVFSTVPEKLFNSFFYTSGWNSLTWPNKAHAPFWVLTIVGLAGLAPWPRAPRLPADVRRGVLVLAVLVLGAFASLWIVRLSNSALPGSLQARVAFSGLAALGCLVALGFERLPVPVAARFCLPLLGVVGTLVALYDDVWRIHVR